MTSLIFSVGQNETILATDTLVTSPERESRGHQSKWLVLPHVNAVVIAGDNRRFGSIVYHDMLMSRVDGIDDLISRVGPMVRRRDKETEAMCGDRGVHYEEQKVWIFTPGRAWGCLKEFGYEPKQWPEKLMQPNGFMVDPDPRGGNAVYPGSLKGDRHIITLMHEQRAKTDKGIGGKIQRIRITHRGLETSVIGDLDAPAQTPEPLPQRSSAPTTAAKPSRNAPCPCGSGHKAKRCCHG